jgi:hypothetical protein
VGERRGARGGGEEGAAAAVGGRGDGGRRRVRVWLGAGTLYTPEGISAALLGWWADFGSWVDYGLALPRVKILLSAKTFFLKINFKNRKMM